MGWNSPLGVLVVMGQDPVAGVMMSLAGEDAVDQCDHHSHQGRNHQVGPPAVGTSTAIELVCLGVPVCVCACLLALLYLDSSGTVVTRGI